MALSLLLAATTFAAEPPIFDVHTHYTWDQAEVTSPEQALAYLDAAGVSKAAVIGTPARLALRIKALAPDRIVALYGPYLVGGEKLSWQFRKGLVEEVRAGLASGQFQGIGELHFIGGMAAHWRRSPVFRDLMRLANEFDVPVMIHTEYASIEPTLEMCKTYADVRILLAHAGAVLPPEAVARLLEQCPNLYMDLAARDPWRYVAQPITDSSGTLFADWRGLIEAFPDRFMIGSDTVWPVDRGISWDEADTGWQEMHRFIDFHRSWLADLPPELAAKVRWSNAERFFRSVQRANP